jgi:hypothetical protein
MSAVTPNADIDRQLGNVRFVPIADTRANFLCPLLGAGSALPAQETEERHCNRSRLTRILIESRRGLSVCV